MKLNAGAAVVAQTMRFNAEMRIEKPVALCFEGECDRRFNLLFLDVKAGTRTDKRP
jgi:hypothetical protein